MKLGDTFIWSPNGGTKHLYIAITDPVKKGGKFVVFNLTNSNHGPKGLTLKTGDHPFITKDSDVNFGDGLIIDLVKINRELDVRRARVNDPMEMQLLQRIAKAAKDHPAVSGEIQDIIVEQWGF